MSRKGVSAPHSSMECSGHSIQSLPLTSLLWNCLQAGCTLETASTLVTEIVHMVQLFRVTLVTSSRVG